LSAALEAAGLRKQYGARVALEDLGFSVEASEILGLLGPNGAGKTTTIRILTTILDPTSGWFTVVGIPHTRPAEIRRVVGALPESAGYPARQTGEEYIRYHARLHGRSRSDARGVAHALLDEVGLEDRGRSLIASYSRGMRQRLGIARALVNDPRVVFLDEPTLGLDPSGQRQVISLVRRLAQERGVAVVLSTHLLAEVEELCARVLILNRGRVVADGTVAEVARRAAAPRSARVRVPPERVADAVRFVAATGVVERAEPSAGQPGSLVLTFAPNDDGPPEEAVPAGLRALFDADIPLLSFEVEGARLSDAFLAMTEPP
jgi:ABC-2 type transport system ATP-binding protein